MAFPYIKNGLYWLALWEANEIEPAHRHSEAKQYQR